MPSSFIPNLKNWTVRNEQGAAGWIARLAQRPIETLHAARGGVESVVFADIGQLFLRVVAEQSLGDREALLHATRMLVSATSRVSASSGPLDATIWGYEACAWSTIVDCAERGGLMKD
jgi:hypothetical protein